MRQVVLEMMRRLEEASEENQRLQQVENIKTNAATGSNQEIEQFLGNVQEQEGR